MLYAFNLESEAEGFFLCVCFFRVLQLLNFLLILTINKILLASSAYASPSLASSLGRRRFSECSPYQGEVDTFTCRWGYTVNMGLSPS